MSDACSLGQFGETLQVSADGRDLWAYVAPCASSTPVFVRSTMSPSDGPLALGNIRWFTKLDDGAMNALGFLVWDSRGLSFYSKDLVRQGDVAGSAGLLAPPSNAVRDYAAVQALYARFDNTLRRLSWTASGATLDPSSYTFASADSPNGAPGWVSDVDAMFISDGNTLLKLTSGGVPTTMASFAGTPIGLLYLTDDRVVVQQSDRSSGQVLAVSTTPKSGGPITTLASGSGAAVIGTMANSVLYSQGSSTHLASADGTSDLVIAGGLPVQQALHIADRWYLDSLAACVPDAPADTGCSNGIFTQTSLATSTPTDIGRFAHTSTYGFANLSAWGGYGASMTTVGVSEPLTYHIARDAAGHQVNTNDLYVWTPSSANSLGQATRNIP